MLNYFGKKYNAGLFRFVGKLFVVIMFLGLDNQYGYTVVVYVRLSKYFCISSGVLHEMVSPSAYSLRAFFIRMYNDGEIWLSSLTRAIRTDATPRISLSVFLMSATLVLSSSVTIIWTGCEGVKVVAIVL